MSVNAKIFNTGEDSSHCVDECWGRSKTILLPQSMSKRKLFSNEIYNRKNQFMTNMMKLNELPLARWLITDWRWRGMKKEAKGLQFELSVNINFKTEKDRIRKTFIHFHWMISDEGMVGCLANDDYRWYAPLSTKQWLPYSIFNSSNSQIISIAANANTYSIIMWIQMNDDCEWSWRICRISFQTSSIFRIGVLVQTYFWIELLHIYI